eukprot:366381-Chlamydomonas_euryale.AAC.8
MHIRHKLHAGADTQQAPAPCRRPCASGTSSVQALIYSRRELRAGAHAQAYASVLLRAIQKCPHSNMWRLQMWSVRFTACGRPAALTAAVPQQLRMGKASPPFPGRFGLRAAQQYRQLCRFGGCGAQHLARATHHGGRWPGTWNPHNLREGRIATRPDPLRLRLRRACPSSSTLQRDARTAAAR